MQPHRRLAAAATAVLLLSTGCSSLLPGDRSAPSDAPGAPPSAPPPPSPAPTPEPELPVGVPKDLGQPVGERTYVHTPTGNEFRLQLFSPRREGERTSLYAHLTTVKAGEKSTPGSWLLSADNLGDYAQSVPSGFTMIDFANRELVFPDRGNLQSACTPAIISPKQGEQGWVHCLFANPKSDVVDVATRNFGVFSDVPVGSGQRVSVPSPKPTSSATPRVYGPDDLEPGEPGRRPMRLSLVDEGGIAGSDDRGAALDATLNSNVAFGKDDATLKPEAQARLREVATALKAKTAGPVVVTGYTDNLGTHEHGVQLSQARAKAVRGVLEPLLPGFTFTDAGRAEADPVAPNDSETNRAKNRRVEVRYTAPKPATPSPTPPPATQTPGPAASPGAPAASREVKTTRGEPFRLDVGEIRRRPGFLEVDLTVNRLGQPDKNVNQVNVLSAKDGVSQAYHQTNGVFLVDPARKQRFVKAPSEQGGECLGTSIGRLGDPQNDSKEHLRCFFATTDARQLELHTASGGLIGTLPVR